MDFSIDTCSLKLVLEEKNIMSSVVYYFKRPNNRFLVSARVLMELLCDKDQNRISERMIRLKQLISIIPKKNFGFIPNMPDVLLREAKREIKRTPILPRNFRNNLYSIVYNTEDLKKFLCEEAKNIEEHFSKKKQYREKDRKLRTSEAISTEDAKKFVSEQKSFQFVEDSELYKNTRRWFNENDVEFSYQDFNSNTHRFKALRCFCNLANLTQCGIFIKNSYDEFYRFLKPKFGDWEDAFIAASSGAYCDYFVTNDSGNLAKLGRLKSLDLIDFEPVSIDIF